MPIRSSPVAPSIRSRSALLIILLAIAGCGSDPVDISETELTGTWSFSDNPQVWSANAGSMRFHEGGTFMVSGSLYLELIVRGTWERTGNVVTLTTDQDVSTWQIERDGRNVRFTETAGQGRRFSIFKTSPD